MRILILAYYLIFCCVSSLFSQQAPQNMPARRAIEHLLEEKMRGFDVAAVLEWTNNHPGQALPQNLDALLENSTSSSDRDDETVVSGNGEAESEVHAAINPTDSANIIVSGIIQDPSSATNPINIPIRRTTNFGQTWQTSSVQFSPVSSPFAVVAGGGDPVIAFDKSGKAYVSWLVLLLDFTADEPFILSLYSSSSTNKGQTWSTPVLVDQGSTSFEVLLGGNGTGSFVDKQWMDVDRSSGPNEGALYVTYTRFNIIDSANIETQILLKKKNKTSNTFEDAVQVHTNLYAFAQFSSIDVDEQGEVHVLFFAGNEADDLALYHTVSTDGGASFSAEQKIANAFYPKYIDPGVASDTIAGVSGNRLYPCPHLQAGKAPGTLFATWSANGSTSQNLPNFDVLFSKSTDNGATWSLPVSVNAGAPNNADQFYPALHVNSQGVIGLGYYDRSEAPGTTLTNYVVTYSDDSGESFRPSQIVTLEPSDFQYIGQANDGFGIGEYTQVVATPNYLIPVWADGRSNDGNIDLYAAFVPMNDIVGVHQGGSLSPDLTVTAVQPAQRQVLLQIELLKAGVATVSVWDAQGKLVQETTANAAPVTGTFNFASQPLAPGAYFCRVRTEWGFRTVKVVVQ
jgi:hypothetical protein